MRHGTVLDPAFPGADARHPATTTPSIVAMRSCSLVISQLFLTTTAPRLLNSSKSSDASSSSRVLEQKRTHSRFGTLYGSGYA